MHTPNFAKLLSDSWPLFIGAIIGTLIAIPRTRRSLDVGRIRKQLGRTLDRFADVPPTRLDQALLIAARTVQHGWRGVASIFGTALMIAAVMFSATLVEALFPGRPEWLSFVVCMSVAGLLAWVMGSIERRAILHRLEHLHNEPGNA